MKAMKLGSETGSFFNHLMSNNNSIPEVGKGATILYWTDREAYEVIEVSNDGKECKIQRYNAKRVDKLGMSDSQEYEYKELTNEVRDLIFRNGSWHFNMNEIVFTKEFLSTCITKYSVVLNLTKEQREDIYQGEAFPQKVVPGITRMKKVYPKVNILFGVKKEYYDYSF